MVIAYLMKIRIEESMAEDAARFLARADVPVPESPGYRGRE